MLQGMDFFCHLQTSPPFARPFRRPLTPVFRRTGTSPSVRVSLSPAFFLSVPDGKHKLPPVCAPNPILEPPAPPPSASVFRRSYFLSVPDGKHKLLPCINNISFILLSRHRPTAQLRFCRQHRISLAKALSFSPSLLLSFSLPPLSALFSRRFTINTCRLTSAASTVSNLKCQFQKLRRPYGQPTYLHPPADADVQTIKKGDTTNRRTPFLRTYRLVNRYFPFLQTREQPSPHLCPAFSARNADRRFC